MQEVDDLGQTVVNDFGVEQFLDSSRQQEIAP